MLMARFSTGERGRTCSKAVAERVQEGNMAGQIQRESRARMLERREKKIKKAGE